MQPRNGFVGQYYEVLASGRPYSQDTSVTNHHKIQILGFNGRIKFVAKKAAAGSTNNYRDTLQPPAKEKG